MLEYHLVKQCLQPEYFEQWYSKVKPSSFSLPARQVWTVLAHYYGSGGAAPTVDVLRAYQAATFDDWKDELPAFEAGLAQVTNLKVDLAPEVVIRLWLEREIAAELAEAADKFLDKPEKFARGFGRVVREHHDKLEAISEPGNEPEDYSMPTFEGLLDQLAAQGTVKWRLDCLNMALGPLYPGMFIVFGGRPESGKTTLLASEATYMLRQMEDGATLVWFNNEQSKPAVEFRLKQAVLRASRDKIRANPTGAEAAFNKVLSNRRILVINVFGKTIHEVEKILATLDNVQLIVFDQASKLGGFERESANGADRLLKLSGHLKGMSASLCPIFTTIWADATAAGEMWVTDDQLYGSKTGIPGEAEAVVNVGHTREPSDEGIRFINIPKNKSMTTQDERQRHGQFAVKIDGVTAEFKNPE